MNREREPKPKTINYRLIPEWQETDGKGKAKQNEPYAIMRDLVKKYHPHLLTAKIALAWRYGFKEDKDGHLVLGQCRKASDLSRELVEFDFIILLNSEVWNSPSFVDSKKVALIDHELCHAAIATDKHGEVKFDARGREVWRIRKHDIDEFREIVWRHGLYKSDLEEFARAIQAAKEMPLLASEITDQES